MFDETQQAAGLQRRAKLRQRRHGALRHGLGPVRADMHMVIDQEYVDGVQRAVFQLPVGGAGQQLLGIFQAAILVAGGQRFFQEALVKGSRAVLGDHLTLAANNVIKDFGVVAAATTHFHDPHTRLNTKERQHFGGPARFVAGSVVIRPGRVLHCLLNGRVVPCLGHIRSYACHQRHGINRDLECQSGHVVAPLSVTRTIDPAGATRKTACRNICAFIENPAIWAGWAWSWQ